MNYVNLGRTGLRVSRLCLGMMSYGKTDNRPWALEEEDAEPIIRRAVEGGITFFDTADVYNEGKSEEITGRVLPKLVTREELVVAAKAQAVATQNGWTRFVSMQNHYNLVYREEEREMIPQCVDQGIGILPWSPLARGLLAGTRTASGERLTKRAETDSFGDSLYTPD